MCVDTEQLTRSANYYGEHYLTQEQLEQERAEIEDYLNLKAYHSNGYSHPLLPVITNEEPHRFQMFRWGLIPFFIKTEKDAELIKKKCLNAMGETIWDRPSYREAAKKRRCLIVLDGFFEHHAYNGKKYPFFISLKKDEPMTVAGLWERWENKATGEIKHTTTIVTTVGNEMMSFIHNSKRTEEVGPRMPLILPKELMWDWLKPLNEKADKELLQELIKPYDEDNMQAWPVRQLLGKNGVGNSPLARESFDYEELPF